MFDMMPCRPDVISCTSDCLQLLTQHLKHLKDIQALGIQRPQDGLMVEVCEAKCMLYDRQSHLHQVLLYCGCSQAYLCFPVRFANGNCHTSAFCCTGNVTSC